MNKILTLIFFCACLCAMEQAEPLPGYSPAAPAYMPAVPQRFFFSETGRPHDVEQARLLQENYNSLRTHRDQRDGISPQNLENIFDNPRFEGEHGSMYVDLALIERPNSPVLYLRKIMTGHRLDAFCLDNPVDDLIPRSFALSDAIMAKLFARPRQAWVDCVAMEQFFADQLPVDDPRLAIAVPVTLARIGLLSPCKWDGEGGETDRSVGSLSDYALPATHLGLLMLAVRRGYSLTQLKEHSTLVKSLKPVAYEKGELFVRYAFLEIPPATAQQKRAYATLRAKVLPGIPYETTPDMEHLRARWRSSDEHAEHAIEGEWAANSAVACAGSLCSKK